MKILSGIAIIIISLIATNLHAGKIHHCGVLHYSSDAFGPFDYNMASLEDLQLVESQHFTKNISDLEHGNDAFLGGEIGYTLNVFPNHYPALQAFAKLSLREKDVQPPGAKYSVECYFDRAIRFKPRDGIVRMLYGNYLLKLKGRSDEAMEQYHEAVKLQPENANINYNLGLLYLKKKDYGQSIIYAKKAYELGFPLPGLRNKLKRAGKWDGKLDENIEEVEP